MFEWLQKEICEVRTPRFHLVDGPADPVLRKAVMHSQLPLPSSYKDFVLKFGNAKLYRSGRDRYRIGVFAGPKEAMLPDGSRIYHVGFHDGASVYLKPTDDSDTFPVFEFESGPEVRVACDFSEWLTASCAQARESFSREKWEEIKRGSAPFTKEEGDIVEARRRIVWRVLGVDALRNHMFEVTNTADRTLEVLTVGVRSKNRRLNGAIRLRIGHIGPGDTAVVYADCYKGLMPSEEIEVFSLPDPQPEDRDVFAEFGHNER